MKRKVYRIRLDPEIYQLFRLRTRHEKTRICEVLESLMQFYAFHPNLLPALKRLTQGGGLEE